MNLYEKAFELAEHFTPVQLRLSGTLFISIGNFLMSGESFSMEDLDVVLEYIRNISRIMIREKEGEE